MRSFANPLRTGTIAPNWVLSGLSALEGLASPGAAEGKPFKWNLGQGASLKIETNCSYRDSSSTIPRDILRGLDGGGVPASATPPPLIPKKASSLRRHLIEEIHYLLPKNAPPNPRWSEGIGIEGERSSFAREADCKTLE